MSPAVEAKSSTTGLPEEYQAGGSVHEEGQG